MHTFPVSSQDAREQRELEQAFAEAEAEEQRTHAATCRGGWIGLDHDERPVPCTVCRPHLAHVACRTCSAPWQSCQSLTTIGRGPCCPDCDHAPRLGTGSIPVHMTCGGA